MNSRLNAEEIFHESRHMPEAARAAYLKGACGNDLALRSKVEALLKADAEAGSFLKSASHTDADPNATIPQSCNVPHNRRDALPSEAAGLMIGRYKLLQSIGEGGFGSVWMAEQEQPVKRRVALKIIKFGMDTKQVIARSTAGTEPGRDVAYGAATL